MTEITRVPLQPIKKGSLPKLWLGIAAAALAGAGLAWSAAAGGVNVIEITAGTGGSPSADDVVFVKYVGKLKDGTEFDRSRDLQLPVPGLLPEGAPLIPSATIPGFAEGMVKMKKGGKYTLEIPADKGYGASPPPGSRIPANADLVFEVELVDFMPREEAERRFQVIQQMMQMQQQQHGAGGQPAMPPPGQ